VLSRTSTIAVDVLQAKVVVCTRGSRITHDELSGTRVGNSKPVRTSLALGSSPVNQVVSSWGRIVVITVVGYRVQLVRACNNMRLALGSVRGVIGHVSSSIGHNIVGAIVNLRDNLQISNHASRCVTSN